MRARSVGQLQSLQNCRRPRSNGFHSQIPVKIHQLERLKRRRKTEIKIERLTEQLESRIPKVET